MRCPQFSLKSLLWLMVCVACFFGGRVLGIKQEHQHYIDDILEERNRLRKIREDRLAQEVKRLQEQTNRMQQLNDEESRQFKQWQAIQRLYRPAPEPSLGDLLQPQYRE